MSKTWRYSMSKIGWDWHDRISGESGFIPDYRKRDRQTVWDRVNIAANNIPKSLSREPALYIHSEKEEVVDNPIPRAKEDTSWLEDKSLDRFNEIK